ncbi:hypothetical protein GCM10009120_49700 [Sphingobacterium siyangense subsp. cladoniae]|uniref:sensor histidine kinase n=1 Tax=Sphingobacterium siyangense TaxID=459529 RepID=UPI0031FA27E8
MANVKLLIRLFVVVMVTLSRGLAQERIYNFLHFTSREGLPSDKIRDAAVDEKGLVWITTGKGLCYFDGNTFFPVSFTQHSDFSYDLGNLSIGSNNKIWVASYNRGLVCYNRSKPQHEAWTSYSAKVAGGDVEKHELYAVHESGGKVFFGGQETDLQILDPVSGRISVVKLAPAAYVTIFRIQEDQHGILWIGTRYHGLFSYEPNSGKTVHYDLSNKGENAVTGICRAGEQVFAAYYNHDLIRLLPQKKRIEQRNILGIGPNVAHYDNNIADVSFFSEENKILAAHSGGKLYSYDLYHKEVVEIPWNRAVPEGSAVKINRIVSIQGGYFICSDHGLFYYSKKLNLIKDLIPTKTDPIQHILKVGDKKWYVSKAQIGELSPDFQLRLSAFSLNNLKISQLVAIGIYIYISTVDSGIYVFDTVRKELRALKIVGNSFGLERADCNSVIWDSVKGRDILWIGSWNSGLYQYDLSTNRVVLYNKENGLIDHKVITLGKDSSGSLWLGMDGFGAVKVVDKVNMKFIDFKHQRQSGESLAANTVFSFLLDIDRHFWYSSSQQGIGMIVEQPGKTRFLQANDRNRFPLFYAHTLKNDIKGRIWMNTRDGVMIFDPTSKTFLQLGAGQGIFPPERFSTHSFYFDSDVLVWMTDKGLIKGPMAEIGNKTENMPPVISAFRILNRDNTYRLVNGKIALQPDENTFSFQFAVPGQLADKTLRFSYKLEGVDREWIDSDAIQQAVYSNIAGGDYRFVLRVGDQDGNWSKAQLDIPVSVKLLWYQGLWFKIGLVSFVFLAVVLILIYRLAHQWKINRMQQEFSLTLQHELKQNECKIREQSEILEMEKEKKLASEFRQQLYESELKAIRSQMNPHFIFNILNSIEAYVVENDAVQASKLIQKFATLSRIVLENSQFSKVTIASELQLVKLYLDLEQERFDHIFTYSIQSDERLIKSNKKIPSMLIQPIVENAVHHGMRHLHDKKGKILIRTALKGKEIRIEILDNGVGFDQFPKTGNNNFKSTSFGLKGVQERLRMLSSDESAESASLTIDKKPDEEDFTVRITITLPL